MCNEFSKRTVCNLQTTVFFLVTIHVTKGIKSLINFIYQKESPMYVSTSCQIWKLVNSIQQSVIIICAYADISNFKQSGTIIFVLKL